MKNIYLRIEGIRGYEETPIAHSENLLGTSNCVFSDWQVQTHFFIKDKKPAAEFKVVTHIFSDRVLFKTTSYEELEKWIEEHLDEIDSQVQYKKDKWIETHKDWIIKR